MDERRTNASDAVSEEAPSARSGGGVGGCLAIVAIVAAILLYLFSVLLVFEIGSGDAHSRALSSGFAMLAQLLMWPLIALIVLLRVTPAAPGAWLGWTGLLLVIGGTAGATVGIGMMGRPDLLLLLPPLLLPPLALGYAFWAPSLARCDEKQRKRAAIAFILVALPLIAAPLAVYGKWVADTPEREARWAREQAEAERRAAAELAAEEARFAALGPGSRLDDVLPFLETSRYAEAKALIPTLESRQPDAVRLVAAAPDLSWLDGLHDFGLDPADPALCRAYGGRIEARLREAIRPNAHQEWMTMELESQLPNLRWFVAGGCDLSGPLRNLRAALRLQPDYVDTGAFDRELATLQRPAPAP
jgi:hypothetical protein